MLKTGPLACLMKPMCLNAAINLDPSAVFAFSKDAWTHADVAFFDGNFFAATSLDEWAVQWPFRCHFSTNENIPVMGSWGLTAAFLSCSEPCHLA